MLKKWSEPRDLTWQDRVLLAVMPTYILVVLTVSLVLAIRYKRCRRNFVKNTVDFLVETDQEMTDNYGYLWTMVILLYLSFVVS